MSVLSVFWYLSWPVLLIIAYQVVKSVILRYEANTKEAK